MSTGAQVKVVIPPEWAFGTETINGKVPPNATLTFKINLVKWVDGESMPKIDLINVGDLQNYPKEGQIVQIHYAGHIISTGEKIDSSYDSGQKIEYELGSGSIIKGFDWALQQMSVGSKCKLTVPPNWAYGVKGHNKIPPNATLQYVIKLFSFKDKALPQAGKHKIKKASFYDYNTVDLYNNNISLAVYHEKVLLIVNAGRQSIHVDQCRKLNKGFSVLGFAQDQKSRNNEEILKWYQDNYKVTFPMFANVNVQGNGMNNIWKYLQNEYKKPINVGSINGNWTKFLVNQNGQVIHRFKPEDSLQKIEIKIQQLLNIKDEINELNSITQKKQIYQDNLFLNI